MKVLNLLCVLFFIYPIFGQTYDKPLLKLEKHTAAIQGLAFSPDSKMLLSGSDDKSAILWDLTTQQPIKIFEGNVSAVKAVAFAPNGMFFFTAADRSIKKWSPEGTLAGEYGGSSTYFWMLSISPDNKWMTSGSFDLYPRIWDLNKPGKFIRSLQGHKKNALVTRFSPDGKYIATGSLDKSINIWSADSFKVIRTFKGHTENIFDLQWFSDSKH